MPAAFATSGGSHVTGVDIAGTEPLGTFHGVTYVRSWGTVFGVVAPGEKVEGFAALPKDANGDYAYTSPFEIIAPARAGENSTILIESENRGSPLMLDALDEIGVTGQPAKARYPHGLGNGFLEDSGISYGRISWQTGLTPAVPATAQGIGEVVMRDFARMLADGTAPRFGRYRTLLFGGISQSSWFVNDFIAEGFNVDPVTRKRVFAGAIAIDGTGNWLALNQLAAADHATEAPYFAPGATPLSGRAILDHPRTDPFYIDVANYTDFYRVHASLTDTAALPAGMRRYDWPSPHHPVRTAADAAATFSANRLGGPCNDGVTVPLNPTSYNPFLRTLVIELAHREDSHDVPHAPALPPPTLFKLGPAPADTAHFNPLPGAALEVPLTDTNAEPEGGVRFPETVVPLGSPIPVSLSPVITTTITGVCGNIGQWQPFTLAEVTQRYGSSTKFLERYGRAIDRLVATGYLLSSQKALMLAEAEALYPKE
jgi:hypothetical protein